MVLLLREERKNRGKPGKSTAPAQVTLKLEDRDLDSPNLRLMLKISYAGCLGLSPTISSQFTVEKCASVKDCKKSSKNPLLWVQGRSKSSMLINIKLQSPVLAMVSRMSVPICNRFRQSVFAVDKPIMAKQRHFRGGAFL